MNYSVKFPERFLTKDNAHQRYNSARKKTEDICKPLEVEDYVVQPRAEVSPPKWHLGHTTWFFEEMLLVPYLKNYKRFNQGHSLIFNSYYKSVGKHWIQGERGQLSRPTVKEIYSYRAYVDKHMSDLLNVVESWDQIKGILEIGLNHEEQHQELLFMDLKSILGMNPSLPSYSKENWVESIPRKREWFNISEGLYEIGHKGESFSFDNERPQHKSYLHNIQISTTLVSNGEYLEFIKDKGYERPELWLSLGLDWVNKNQIKAPLYWNQENDKFYEYSLYGLNELDPYAPVTHISYFESYAFAKWAGGRLPTEQELEIFEKNSQNKNDVSHLNLVHPKELDQKLGQVWCWSSSQYSPYPGFKTFKRGVSEYNGKFMCNQFVLRGGCVVTPEGHYRETYRNFYFPEQRWMFSGIRLAKGQ